MFKLLTGAQQDKSVLKLLNKGSYRQLQKQNKIIGKQY